MTEQAITPRPLGHLHITELNGSYSIYTSYGMLVAVAPPTSRLRAVKFVQAVNNYDALKDAAEGMAEAIIKLRRAVDEATDWNWLEEEAEKTIPPDVMKLITDVTTDDCPPLAAYEALVKELETPTLYDAAQDGPGHEIE